MMFQVIFMVIPGKFVFPFYHQLVFLLRCNSGTGVKKMFENRFAL